MNGLGEASLGDEDDRGCVYFSAITVRFAFMFEYMNLFGIEICN